MVQIKIIKNTPALIDRDINEFLRELDKQLITKPMATHTIVAEIKVQDVKLYKFDEKEITAMVIYEEVISYLNIPMVMSDMTKD